MAAPTYVTALTAAAMMTSSKDSAPLRFGLETLKSSFSLSLTFSLRPEDSLLPYPLKYADHSVSTSSSIPNLEDRSRIELYHAFSLSLEGVR